MPRGKGKRQNNATTGAITRQKKAKDAVFSPSAVPTNKDKETSAKSYTEKLPYGLISKKEINWISSERTKLGEGTYGQVFKYANTPDGVVAVKFVKHGYEIQESVVKEISFLRAISHPNVINILDIFYDKENIAVVLPLANDTLLGVRQNKKIGNKPLTPTLIDSILYQVLRGIVATQEHNILNGDYKTANILLYDTPDFVNVKIADFGLAILDGCYNVEDNFVKFTVMYRAPELLWFFLTDGPENRQRAEDDLKEAEELLETQYKEKNNKNVPNKKNKGRKAKVAAKPKQTTEEIKQEEDYKDREILITEEQIKRLKSRLERPFPGKIGKYTKKADSWSYGVIILELLTNRYPFSGTGHEFGDYSHLRTMYTRLGRPTLETLPDIADTPIYSTREYIKFDLEFDEKLRKDREGVVVGYRNMDDYLVSLAAIDKEYVKYIPLLKQLLVLDPRQRVELKDLINNPVFDNVREEVDNKNGYKDLKEIRSPDKCSKYLRNYQYPKIDNQVSIFESPRIRYILYDWLNELCEEYHLSARTKAITCKIVEMFAVKNLEESKRDGVQPDWERRKYQGYLSAAVLLAANFDGINLDIGDMLYISENAYTREQLFVFALAIFASIDFNMVKSTAYDLFDIYKSEDTESVGKVLLQFTYFTELYSNYNNDVIASLIYVITCIIKRKKINKKYAKIGIAGAWDMFRDNLVSIVGNLMKRNEIGLTKYVAMKDGKKTNGEEVIKAMANIAIPLGLPYTPFGNK